MNQTFSWAAFQDVAIGGLKGATNWLTSRGAADAQRITAEAARKANNTIAASKNSLAAVIRNINNANLMRAAQAQYNAGATNLARANEAATSQNFESSLARSEREGANAASLAASGVGGSALLATSTAFTLQQERLKYQAQQQQGQVRYNIAAQMAGIMPAATLATERGSLGNYTDQVQRGSSSSGGNAFSLLAAVAVGAMNQKDSFQVMLDSMGGKSEQPTTYPVSRGVVEPYSLQSNPVFLESTPVTQGSVQPYSLAPLQTSSTKSVLGGL